MLRGEGRVGVIATFLVLSLPHARARCALVVSVVEMQSEAAYLLRETRIRNRISPLTSPELQQHWRESLPAPVTIAALKDIRDKTTPSGGILSEPKGSAREVRKGMALAEIRDLNPKTRADIVLALKKFEDFAIEKAEGKTGEFDRDPEGFIAHNFTQESIQDLNIKLNEMILMRILMRDTKIRDLMTAKQMNNNDVLLLARLLLGHELSSELMASAQMSKGVNGDPRDRFMDRLKLSLATVERAQGSDLDSRVAYAFAQLGKPKVNPTESPSSIESPHRSILRPSLGSVLTSSADFQPSPLPPELIRIATPEDLAVAKSRDPESFPPDSQGTQPPHDHVEKTAAPFESPFSLAKNPPIESPFSLVKEPPASSPSPQPQPQQPTTMLGSVLSALSQRRLEDRPSRVEGAPITDKSVYYRSSDANESKVDWLAQNISTPTGSGREAADLFQQYVGQIIEVRLNTDGGYSENSVRIKGVVEINGVYYLDFDYLTGTRIGVRFKATENLRLRLARFSHPRVIVN